MLAYATAAEEDLVPGICAHLRTAAEPAVRLGLLLALGRCAEAPEARARLRRGLRGEPAEALGAALGLLLRPAAHGTGAWSGSAATRPLAPEDEEAVLGALTRCAGDAGPALAELAWCDPEWAGPPPSGPVDTVDSWLAPVPALRSRWLARLLAGPVDEDMDPAVARVLIAAADRLCAADPERYAPHATAVAALLAHPDPQVRRAAVLADCLTHYGSCLDALAAVVNGRAAAEQDPAVADAALGALARRGDPRCVPGIAARVRAGTAPAALLEQARERAGELWPVVRERLGRDLPPGEAGALLSGTAGWPGGERAVPEAAGVLERLSRRIDATVRGGSGDGTGPGGCPGFAALEAAAAACTFLRRRGSDDPEALAVLRRVAGGADPETGLAAIRALMGRGVRVPGGAVGPDVADEVVPLLLGVLARRPRTGRVAGRRGWRFDANACAWLGELGPLAGDAAPVLRGLCGDPAEPEALRTAAADALHRITGEAAQPARGGAGAPARDRP
ncbi:hypothetical protein MUU72_05400 [Streptomyces sp. RS10V-4]|uniref:hypothetical protein n=1 Tax=Streptomyces rhizoryzae TaxID=2932493 RepID=UPI002002AD87|nr:hypothetical protein [Streptomyces rhizoryzae]MCK7622547.1 hypothetical protein [Streptomyces rhizoryzae]